MDINQKALNLVEEQVIHWDIASKNYAGLKSVEQRKIDFDGFSVFVQFNPERIRSSAAKVDAQSIKERQCFLCSENLPLQQQGLQYLSEYTILVNPFPIFNKHLTIPLNKHLPQLISGHIGMMLQMAKDLYSFTIFYNGPKCGASAPDHFHFQAGNKGFLPIENDFSTFKNKKCLYELEEGSVWTLEYYLRKTLIISSTNPIWVEREFYKFYNSFSAIQDNELEPMLNILATFDNDVYKLYLFPRQKHRPSQFFEEGEKQILFSPASVDFGGILITPRKEDYLKLTPELIADMFIQVTLDDNNWNKLKKGLQDDAV